MKYNELTELEADIFMPEMHFRQPGFTYSASRPFSKIKEGIQIFKERRYSKYIYKNELDKACFHHDMFHGDFNDLPRLIIAYKLLANKTFIITKSQKYDKYQGGLASMPHKFFDK